MVYYRTAPASDASLLTDFLYFRPKAGTPEDPALKTVAYLMYNNEGIYVGGYCHERTKDSIATELTGPGWLWHQ